MGRSRKKAMSYSYSIIFVTWSGHLIDILDKFCQIKLIYVNMLSWYKTTAMKLIYFFGKPLNLTNT